ncbi:MAG TPA: zinc-dependent metalloprotease family protein, partial [Thermomonas sp.]|nr:zinc-dependent metalloprotease family protein [Thermomonas sp.]
MTLSFLLRPLGVLLALLGLLLSTSPARAAVTGELRTAVVLVNFQDNASQPITTATAHSTVFGQVSDFLWENSYQQLLLSGQTHGWYTLPLSATQCDTTAIAREADRAAAAAGVALQGYQTIVYMFPATTACGWSGTGGSNAAGQKLIFIHDRAGMTAKVIAHEFGHSFGLMHSDGMDCDGGPLSGTCVQQGYADPADTMGNRLGHFNAFQKELLGWLGTAATPAIQTVTASGRYRIDPLSAAGNGTRALRLSRGPDAQGRPRWYYLEYRQAVGFDAGLATVGTLTRGVLLHLGTQGDVFSSRVLDMTPGSNEASRTADFEDGALLPGSSYRDAAAGITVSVVSADAAGAMVDVAIDAVQPPPPPASTLGVAGGTDKVSYLRSQTVYMSALVRVDGAVAGGVSVSFAVRNPAGGTTNYAAVSGTDGYARASFKLGKAKSALGSYTLGIGASQGQL